MATPQLNTSQIHNDIASLGQGKVDEFSFNRIKRDIDSLRKHNNTAASDLMAMLYFYKGDYSSAIDQHKTAIQLEPNLAMLYSNYGITLRTAKKPVEAQKQLLKALSLHPTGEELAVTLANMITVSIELYDLEALNEITKKYPKEVEEYAMTMVPNEAHVKLSELQALAKETDVSQEKLMLFFQRITRFIKQEKLEPVSSRAFPDPEGGFFVDYVLPVGVDELMRIRDKYVDFLIDDGVSDLDVSGGFCCA